MNNQSQFQRRNRASSNFFSQIIDESVYQHKKMNPEFMRVKNNILLLLLILASYGMYYLFSDFLNTMLIAFIAGIGYQQIRNRFIQLINKARKKTFDNISISLRLLKSLPFLVGLIILPWFRYIFCRQGNFKDNLIDNLSIYSVFNSLFMTKNLIIRGCQLYLFGKILQNLIGVQIKSNLLKVLPKKRQYLNLIFAFIFLLFTIFCLVSIPIILTRQIYTIGAAFETKVQNQFGCIIVNNPYRPPKANINTNQVILQNKTSKSLPLCSEIVFTNNEFIKNTLQQFKNQSQVIQACISTISGFEQRYIGYQIFASEAIVCEWFSIGYKAANYLFSDTKHMMITTGSIFTTAFGHLTYVISSFSNIIFSLTTFITIFWVTIHHFNSQASFLQEILHGQRLELLGQITNLIQGTLFIVLQHFIFSLVLLQLFYFSDVNLLLAITLSSMAFFPFFRPWFAVALFSLFKSIFSGQWITCGLFAIIYYYMSQKIFSNCFKKMQIHQIFINMSVLFGIYQFGVAGIFYGPVIILLFQSVHRQLLRTYMTIDNQSQ